MTGATPETRALSAARALLGVLFVIRTTALANLLPIPLAHVSGWLLGWPNDTFRFAWLDLVLPASMVAALCVARTIAGVAFALGFAPRSWGLLASATAFAVLSQDPFGAYYTLLVLFGGVALVAVAYPVRWDDTRGGWLIVAFVVSVYAWSGIAKLHASWLDGGVLRALAEDRQLHEPIARWLLANPALRQVMALAVPGTELALATLLAVRRTRRAAVFAAVGMHVVFELAARPDVIGWAMIALLVACLGTCTKRPT